MSNCLGVVLAGGLSTRMGQDKAHLQRTGQSMLEYTADQLRALGLETVYSGQSDYGGISDIFAETGPVGGIYSVLRDESADALLVVPVDMPLLDSKSLKYLLDIGRRQNAAVCYQNCYLPLYLPVTETLKSHLASLFENHDNAQSKRAFSIRGLLAKVPHLEVPTTQPEQLLNTNTPEEWEQALKILESPATDSSTKPALDSVGR